MGIDSARVGQRITHLRELRGESLSAVAERAKIAKSYLLKLERGEVENPGLRTLDSIAKALRMTLADLLAPSSEANAEQAESRATLVDYERVRSELPSGLSDFVTEFEKRNGRMPSDVLNSLATLQFRGKRPESVRDWQFVYDAISRALGD
jgi:transcriptional regulator with XRE-family HTH domain